jgi:hypothetical protein
MKNEEGGEISNVEYPMFNVEVEYSCSSSFSQWLTAFELPRKSVLLAACSF